RHAVHARDRVQERGERVVHVVRQLAGGRRVDAEIDTAGPQGGGDPGEHQVRPRLVVHRVEGGDEVEPGVLVKAGGVTLLEARVRQAAASGLGARGRDPGFGK